MKEYIQLILTLYELMGGNIDLIEKIIRLKIKGEKEDIFKNSQEFWIENNFYNWLGNDIVLRKKIKLNGIYPNPHAKYYKTYNGILGLTNYRRTKGLNECFNDIWWKCTEKVSVKWSDIHRIMRSDISVYELIGNGGEDVLLEMESDIDYYFDNDLFYEKNGLERIGYVNDVFSRYIETGRFLFEDMDSIYVNNGNILFVS